MTHELKFRYIYGIPGKPETYFAKVFTIDEIENAYPTNVLLNFGEYRDYQIISRDQYTGLVDKNGSEIFKNDILSFVYDGEIFNAGSVKWRTDVCMWAVDIGIGLTCIEPEDAWVKECEYEITGNIHGIK